MQKFPLFQVHAHVLGEGSCFEKYQITGNEVSLHDLSAFLGDLGCLSGQGYAEPVPVSDVHETRAIHTVSGHASVPVTHVFPGVVLCVKL